MNKLLILIATVISAQVVQAQAFGCNEILNHSLAINNCSVTDRDSCVIYDLERIYPCLGLSATDKVVFAPVIVATQLYSNIGNDTLTYQDLIEEYRKLLGSPIYFKIKAFQLQLKIFEDEKVSQSSWIEFSEGLKAVGYSNLELDSVREYFQVDADSTLTFINSYSQSVTPGLKREWPTNWEKAFDTFENLELTMEMAKRKDKPALIYFSNLQDPTSIEFTKILKEDKNLQLISSGYDAYFAFADSGIKLSAYDKVALGLDPNIEMTKGSYIQTVTDKLTSTETPLPLILVFNANGQVDAVFNAPGTVEELHEFLEDHTNVDKSVPAVKN